MLEKTPPLDTSTLSLVKEIIEFVARRNLLTQEIKADFSSEVFIKLLNNDGAIIKSFKGNSTLKTFLTVVIQRAFLDYRDKTWGRWRPSTLAKRSGPVAILCEQYMHRDGHSFKETYHFLKHNHQLNHSEDELRQIVNQLPVRTRKKKVGEEHLSNYPTQEGNPDETLLRTEKEAKNQKAKDALQSCLAELDEVDRQILRLRYERDLPVSDVAKTLNLNQKTLYRSIPKILKRLQLLLKEKGIHSFEVDLLSL